MHFLRQNWQYLIGAALLHGLFAGLFALTMLSLPRKPPPPQLAINATLVIDPSLTATTRRAEKAQQEREQAAARDKAAAEQRRQKEADAQQEAEQRAEQERQVELKQRQEKEQQRLQEEQQVRERQDTERKRQAEVEKQQQAQAERTRVAEIERKQKDEAQRRKAADDARALAARESELKNQLAEEEGRMQAENAGLLNQYVAMIEQRIVRNWNRPPSARAGLECEVKVAQTPAGTVLSAQVGKCNGDEAVRQSIEAAVLRSSPLPPPPDPRLFERNLLLVFRPAE
jgi:colicin import membrane protein